MEDENRKALYQRAKLMGLKVSPNMGAGLLGELINATLRGESPGIREEAAPQVKRETEREKRARLLKEANRLVRCRITCMNPNKRDLEGEIHAVGNRYVGTLRKYIPYKGVEWHVPAMLLSKLESAKFLNIRTMKGRGGFPVHVAEDIKEFAIDILPPLTQKELKELAQRQAMASGTASSV